MNKIVVEKVQLLIQAYKTGKLGDITMPEDTHPLFKNTEQKLLYYTLPMALNYQRNSYKLWESAKKTWEDDSVNIVFKLDQVSKLDTVTVQKFLLKHKLGLQPNKHTDTWIKISKTIYDNWVSISELLKQSNNDYLVLKDIVQYKYKKGFPYLSGPKIFNYWSYILGEYCDTNLLNREYIEIAPDTHVIQASVKLGMIDSKECSILSREEISKRWRNVLEGSGISPIDAHSPLWFWSRGGFKVEV